MRNINIVIIIVFLLITSCTNSEKNTDFDKGPILENIAYNHAIPAYESSLKAFISLDTAIIFLEEYNNEYNLKVVQGLWKDAAVSWAKTAPYNFGPIDELLIENNFHYFPLDTSKLQAALIKFNGDENFINEMGSDSRGLAALEYLLFSTTQPIELNKIAFANMLSSNLVNLNQEILAQWKSDYAKTFVSNTGSKISSSITLLTNQWIELSEKIKNDKIGKPTGKIAGTEKDLQMSPAPFSNTSLAIIKANLSALQQSFNGGKGKGVDDYLNALDIKDADGISLSEKINLKFEMLIKLLDGQKNKTFADLINQDAEKLDQIYLETLNLSILLKTDMMGQLGLITTFSDSDGD